MTNKLIYNSKTPLGFYFGLVLSIFSLLFFVTKIGIPEGLIYPTIIIGIWYLTISRFSCRLLIYTDRVIVKYIAFWHKDKEISLINKKDLKVKLNYWTFSSEYDYHRHKHYIFYDKISFVDNEGKTESINFNVRIGDRKKVIKTLNEFVK